MPPLRHDPDCVALTDTWLTMEVPNNLLIPADQYYVFSKDRNARAGGVN
jgi:hypothetical protein